MQNATNRNHVSHPTTSHSEAEQPVPARKPRIAFTSRKMQGGEAEERRINVEAQVETLKQTALDGIPFYDECVR